MPGEMNSRQIGNGEPARQRSCPDALRSSKSSWSTGGTLLREIAEELTVALLPETVRHVATYEADQVRMTCYTADFAGTLAASSEIDELAWFCYADRSRVPPVDQLLFDDLQAARRLR